MLKYFALIVLICLVSCNKIETHQTLNQDDLNFIKGLKLLDEKETVYKFYSEDTKKTAGNFFTNKRVAPYWIDKRNSKNNKLDFAFYKDIIKIDTGKIAGATYCPYALITKRDHTKFEVSVDGSRQEKKSFFEGLLYQWKRNAKTK